MKGGSSRHLRVTRFATGLFLESSPDGQRAANQGGSRMGKIHIRVQDSFLQ